MHEKIHPLILGVESELDILSTGVEHPSGELKITAPSGFSRGFITRQIANFANQYPNVKLTISYSDQHEDIIASGIDLAIRGGAMKDSGLMSRKVFTLERKLVAAPAFIKSTQKITSPVDLTSLSWIWHRYTSNYRIFKHRKSGRSHKIKMNPVMVVDNGDAMCNLAVEGLGLMTLPTYLMSEYLGTGQLVEVLPDWSLDPFEINAVWPGNSPRTGITSRFVDYLAEAKID